ncbi:MAG: SLOG family protein [Gemmataceae bacterium]
MRVIVSGAVGWSDTEAIRRELHKLPPETTIIHGDCLGADALANQIATELGLAVEPMAKNDADYAKYQRAAWKGLNERMLNSGCELVLGFHPDLERSQGTKHMAEIARAAGVPVFIFDS